ncbi:bacterioferritin-associated ferredoxin-like protein [Niveispirillum sp. SYP-B3756]|uniref:(2Fe-2S)-binding protein n=1 Tax=Niveispirillum sp. SYP-B3756 TaxID=2662178 RepID=UPI001291B658|nr:(2Fe-2S)-binding protein [Niveispirillum sp. SYP-B3756]MQP66305.1 bacterioferritin-associated ferredoxin-like protein [Niveispirillum sp. SYP-B3756]
MYVCVCNAINCKSVRRTVENGASSVASVFKACGKTPQCGRCVSMIRDMVGAARPSACNDHAHGHDMAPAIAAE